MNSPGRACLTIHGFLGEGPSFDFLSPIYDLQKNIDLRPMAQENLSYEDMLRRVQTECQNFISSLPEEGYLDIVSYSFGAKVLVSLLNEWKLPYQKIRFVFLSAHYGQFLNEADWQEEVLRTELLKQKSLAALDQGIDVFLEFWKGLPLFAQEKDFETSWSSAMIRHYLNYWFRPQPTDVYTFLKLNYEGQRIDVMYGENDPKYRLQAERFLERSKEDSNIHFVMLEEATHRILKYQSCIFESVAADDEKL